MDNKGIIGRKVKWIVFGLLGIETVLGKIVDYTEMDGYYRVEGYTLFGMRHKEIKNITELEFE